MNNNTIKVQRNRRCPLSIALYTDADPPQPYTLAEGETLIFGVKRVPEDSAYLYTKTLTTEDYDSATGEYAFSIPTASMDMPAGDYFYDIVISGADDELDPVIPLSRFEVGRSVVTP